MAAQGHYWWLGTLPLSGQHAEVGPSFNFFSATAKSDCQFSHGSKRIKTSFALKQPVIRPRAGELLHVFSFWPQLHTRIFFFILLSKMRWALRVAGGRDMWDHTLVRGFAQTTLAGKLLQNLTAGPQELLHWL